MKKFAIMGLLLLSTVAANAEILQLTENPQGWKLENYIGGTVVAWYTGAQCPNGKVDFPDNATNMDRDRFWSLVLTAKVANKDVFVRYDNASCKIASFGLPQE